MSFHQPVLRWKVRVLAPALQAASLNGYTWLHGVKGGRMIHVGAVDAPVSVGDVTQIASEFKRAIGTGKDAPKTNGVDLLGWDFAFEMNEVAFEVVRLVGAEAQRRQVPLRMEFTDAATQVFADRVHVQHVLMNLLLNAMEAMADTPAAKRRLFIRTNVNSSDTVETFLGTRSGPYRDLGLAERVPPREELIRLMVENPNLVRRPIARRGDRIVIGADEAALRELASDG